MGQIARLADERRAAAPAQKAAEALKKAAAGSPTREMQERYLAEISPSAHAAMQRGR